MLLVAWTILFASLGALIRPRNGWEPIVGAAIAGVFAVFGLLFLVLVRGGNLTNAELAQRRAWADWYAWSQGRPQVPRSVERSQVVAFLGLTIGLVLLIYQLLHLA